MRGRIFITPALVLDRREFREADRLSVLYTRDFGKLRARFIGVNRPKGKLKALSEPLAHGEYRLYLRDGAEFGIAAGGALMTVHPRLRENLLSTLRGLEIVELLDRLTPFWNPNVEKYELAVRSLAALEEGAGSRAEDGSGDWVVAAFALRLLKAAGFGIRDRRISEENRSLWDALHRAGIDEVARLPPDPPRQHRLERFIRRCVEQVTEQPLNCCAMRDKLIGVKEYA